MKTVDRFGELEKVFADGHSGEKEWRVGVRWTGLVLWAPKAMCHLSPALIPQPKRAGGCLRTATGVDLEHLVVITRLEAAWAFGCAGAVDWVDCMDRMGLTDRKDEGLCLAKGTKGHENARVGTKMHA